MQSQNAAAIVVVALVVALAVLLLGGMGLAGAGMLGVGMMGGMGLGLPLMGGLLMLVVPVLFVAGLVWLVVALARGNSSPAATTRFAPQPSPLDILKARYARGEISKEQFDEMQQHIGI